MIQTHVLLLGDRSEERLSPPVRSARGEVMLPRRRHIACIRIADFPVQAELIRRPELMGRPVVVLAAYSASGVNVGSVIASCSDAAKARGLNVGMKVRDVWAHCPEAVILPPDPKYYETLSHAMFDALEGVVPIVEEAGLGCAYTDLSGMEKLYPDVRKLLQEMIQAAQKATGGLRATVCVGPNKFVAGVATQLDHIDNLTVIEPSEAAGFLAPLSVQYLPIEQETKERLIDFGLRRLGQIARLNVGDMLVQFGHEGRLAWELSQGMDNEPVVARRSFRPIDETIRFSAPLSEWGGFWAALRQLLARVWHRPERRGLGIRQLHVIACTEEQTWERYVTFHEPITERERLEDIVRNRLYGTTLPGAILEMTLQITVLGGPYVRQASFFDEEHEHWNRIKHALGAVKARHGTTHLYRIAEVEPWSRIPERRYALISFDP